MNPHKHSDFTDVTLRELSYHWDARRDASDSASAPPRPFTIALAREAGTQGTLVAREVGKRLGWPVYDHELLERIAQDRGWHIKLLESVDERHLNWLNETTQTLLGVLSIGESAYVHQLVKTMLALSIHGQCIIVGRGAAHRLPPETTFRVRLCAPLSHRIATYARNEGIPEKQAARQITDLDRQHTLFVREHFLRDPRDPLGYDLILNVSRLLVPGCVHLIVEGLSCLEARAESVPTPAHPIAQTTGN